MNGASIAASGGSQPHENRSPYLALNFIIAWAGIYPSQG
jgi:microcystin-dependent protein